MSLSDDPHSIDELVSRWQRSRAAGQTLSADELTNNGGGREELERRLQAVASMMSFLGLEAAATVGGATDAPDAVVRPLPEIAGYEVLEELGRGGMGVVYRARHLGLNRMVALKMVLDARRASAEELARFRSEAEAVAALQHPNIVQIFECGTHADLPFFTLEYIGGGSLAAKVSDRPLPPAESARLVEQLARGVAYAHDMGIVHRDLKPGNVLVSDETPKITDFGLAKRLGLGSPGEGVTRAGSILGTPSYMAPEQASGNQEVGPAADIWSLGAILYKLITGRPPFQAATPLETLRQIERDEPAPPRRLNHAVPEDLETVCLKCLQKDPIRRYASAAALADDLKRFLDDVPVLARPVTRLERGWRWCRRNPARAGLAAALLLVVAASLPVMTILWQRAENQRGLAVEQQGKALTAAADAKYQQHVAERESRIARAEAERAERVAQVLIGMFQASDPLGLDALPIARPRSVEALTALAVLDRGAAQAMTGLENDPLTKARLLDTLGNVYCTLGLTAKGGPLLECALDTRRKTLPADHPDLAASLQNLGWLFHQTGDYAQAESLYREALGIRRQHADAAPLPLSSTLFNLGWLMADLEEFPAAEQMFQEVLELRRKHLGEEHRDVAVANVGLAAVYINEGKTAAALAPYLRAKAILAKSVDPGLVESIDLFQSALLTRELPAIGRGTFGLDPLEKAERSLKKSLELAVKAVGDRHVFVGLIQHELAQTLVQHGHDEEAERYFRDCLQILRQVGLAHPKGGILLSNFCRLLRKRGKFAEAEALFAEALKARELLYGPTHPLVADIKFIHAELLQGEAHRLRQEQMLREAIDIYRINSTGARLNYVHSLNHLAILIDQQRPGEAEKLLREAMPLAHKYAEHQSDFLVAILCNLVNVLVIQAKFDGVEELLEEARSLCKGKPGITPATRRRLWTNFAEFYLATDRPAKAAEAVLLRRASCGGDAKQLFEAAAELARCVARLGEGTDDRGKYAALAMETLCQATAKGFRDGQRLRDDRRFDSLRQRPDFVRLLAELPVGGPN